MKRVVLILLLFALPLASRAAATRTLQSGMPAAKVSHVTIDAGVGQLKLTSSSDDKLHVQVELQQKSENFLWFFHWMSQSTARQIAAVTLQQKSENDDVTYSLVYPDHLDEGDIKQIWTIQLPARLAVKVRMKVGEMNLQGVSGGVDAKLEVGQLTIETPGGPIRASVNVGQIRATSATTQPGAIRISSNIGDARLEMPNWQDQDKGDHTGLGRTIRVSGTGSDNMDLDVNIGDARLRIAPARSTAR